MSMGRNLPRSSKFRHVFGEPSKMETSYTDVKALSAGEGNFIKVNPNFFAVAKPGGGGPLLIHPIAEYGRFGISHPVLNVHKGQVLDMDFHPFENNVIATASDDCSIAVTRIPEEGLVESITEPDAVLRGHTKKMTLIFWHPTARNVIASCAFDKDIKIWDLTAEEDILSFFGHEELIHSIVWSHDGSLLMSTSRDRQVRIFDPRVSDAVMEAEGHQGSKTSRGFWCPNMNVVGCVGFTKTSQRRILFWDPRKMGDPVHRTDLDQAASVLCPFYDPDCSILYLAGKGDGIIRYFELSPQEGFCHYLSDFRHTQPQKGVAYMPKRGCDTNKAEIALFYRLTRDSVHPVSMQCPRKNAGDVFQDDIYPPAFAGKPAMEANEYFEGTNKDPVLMSLKPEGAPSGRAAARVRPTRSAFASKAPTAPANAGVASATLPSPEKTKYTPPSRSAVAGEAATVRASAGRKLEAAASPSVTREASSKRRSSDAAAKKKKKKTDDLKDKLKEKEQKVAELTEEVAEADKIIGDQAARIKNLTEKLARAMV